MPVPDEHLGAEADKPQDSGRDRDRHSKGGQSSKAKDLSHVPCKFFKVGACTAGASCPFSHATSEPGQSKDVCAWYPKGNCKFGHKCALAHILPGQPMTMDRKNKKAAQLAAGGGQNRDKGNKGGRKDGGGGGGGSGAPRNALLGGQAPGSRTSTSRPAPMNMPLKAALSPSAPAPPVQDTDFASLGALADDSVKLPSAPGLTKTSPTSHHDSISTTEPPPAPPPELSSTVEVPTAQPPPPPAPQAIHRESVPAPLPLSHPRRLADRRPSQDFGPIGSPPRQNGFSPGTSPSSRNLTNTNFAASTSPFSAPGGQSMFMPSVNAEDKVKIADGLRQISGLASSLGMGRGWGMDQQLSSSSARSIANPRVAVNNNNQDDDLEDFLPSSLTDLLTPEERSRRMIRTTSGNYALNPHGKMGPREYSLGVPLSGVESTAGYSRSVPAPSLLNDPKSIWGMDNALALPSSPTKSGTSPSAHQGLVGFGSGTPSSYRSNGALSGRSFVDDAGLGPGAGGITPSNASGAFLPGLHHHYFSGKPNLGAASGNGASANLRAGGLGYPPQFQQSSRSTTAAHLSSEMQGASALSPPRTAGNLPSFNTSSSSRPPFEHNPSDPYLLSSTSGIGGRSVAMPSNLLENTPAHHHPQQHLSALSPSARALQAHNPGQSLPQGLAAGYSRIHALPPMMPLASPGAASALGSSAGGSPHGSGSATGSFAAAQNDWLNNSNNNREGGLGAGAGVAGGPQVTGTGLDAMFSRLSYSAATGTGRAQPSPGMNRIPSGRGGAGVSSPLSRPVQTGDDEDIFSFDG